MPTLFVMLGKRSLTASLASYASRNHYSARCRSEERRVGKEFRSRWSPEHYKKRKTLIDDIHNYTS